MKDFPLHNDGNVVPLDTKLKPKADARDHERQAFEKAVPGAKDDPRMQEAVRLMEAFFAIEAPAACTIFIPKGIIGGRTPQTPEGLISSATGKPTRIIL